MGYVGNGTANYLQFNTVTCAAAGTYTLTVHYASGEARSTQISVNGAAPLTVATPSTGGWDTVGTVTVSVALAAGTNTLRFGNTTGWAPDFDRIQVT